MPVARLVSSPLPRCLATAEAIRQELGPVEVTTHDGLAECRYGSWSGQPLAELAKDPLWKVVQEQPSAVRFPDGELPGESMASMAARAIAAIREVDAEVAHWVRRVEAELASQEQPDDASADRVRLQAPDAVV